MHKHLVLNLTVRVIQTLIKGCEQIIFHQQTGILRVIKQLRTAGVAGSAGLNFLLAVARLAAAGRAVVVVLPGHTFTLIKAHRKPKGRGHIWISVRSSGPLQVI